MLKPHAKDMDSKISQLAGLSILSAVGLAYWQMWLRRDGWRPARYLAFGLPGMWGIHWRLRCRVASRPAEMATVLRWHPAIDLCVC